MKILIFAIALTLIVACSDSGTVYSDDYPRNTQPGQATIIPGTTFSIIDAYLSTYAMYAVFKNNLSVKLPSFYIDYKIECSSGYTQYDQLYLSLGAYEQISKMFSVGANATMCSITIMTVRSSNNYLMQKGFIPWEGSYIINTR